MLEFLIRSEEDAIAILKQDHDKVKALFDAFQRADNLRQKKKIAAEAIMELKIHAAIEEEIFYPTVRRQVESGLMNEADEEHHVAKLLIAELDQMTGSEDHFEAKFHVLAENIRHHIREEEGKMLPQARDTGIDFETLGRRLLDRKQKLKQNGVPASDEDKLMAGTKGRVDSPARAARAGRTTRQPTANRVKKPMKERATASKQRTAPKKRPAQKMPARRAKRS